LRRVRAAVGEMTLLVPGVGTQAGDVAAVIAAGVNGRNSGLIVNASRSVLYASRTADFAEAARTEATRLRDQINELRGRL
jgi:orotidine-5'-phosphate decarboxylase